MDRESFKSGFKKGLPIGIGYLAVSFSFGVMAIKHISPLMATIISLTNVSSLGQFAGVNMMAEYASFIEIGLTVLLINLRYALMSIALSQKLDPNIPTWQRMIFGFAITDEVFAVASSERKKIKTSFMAGLAILPILGWVLGTALGAFGGSIVPDRVLNAFGIALYSMFVALLIPDAKRDKAVMVVALIAITISCIFHFVPYINEIGSGFKTIIATIIAASIGSILFPIRDEEEKENAV